VTPVDINGTLIKAGDRIAYAITYGNSAALCIYEVLLVREDGSLQVQKQQQGSSAARYFGAGFKPSIIRQAEDKAVVL
jgi:hypothetical protein